MAYSRSTNVTRFCIFSGAVIGETYDSHQSVSFADNGSFPDNSWRRVGA